MADEKQKYNFILVNEFTEYGVEQFKSNFDRLRNQNIPIIPVYVDSFGGEIYSLLAMLDIIENSDVPVATIAMGKAMSCGSVLLACGTPGLRFIGRHSTVMIHDAGTVSFGKIEDLKADVGEAERLNNIIFDLLAQRCGKGKDYFRRLVEQKKHANWYLTSEEAQSHNLVDHIGLPVLDTQYNIRVPQNVHLKPKRVKKSEKNKSKKK